MIDESDLLDPGKNFTAPENQPFGARIPEFAIRQLIGWSIQQIRLTLDEPVNLIDELFRLYGPDVVAQIKGYLRDHTNLPVVVNWPQEDAQVPFISVINQGEQEDSEFVFLGDAGGAMRYGTISGGVDTAREQRVVGLNAVTNIFIGTGDANLTMYLYHLVKFIIFSNKDKLAEYYDLHNMKINGQDLQLDQTNLMPILGYFRVIQLHYQTVFDYNVSDEAAKIISFELLMATRDNDDAEVIVSVPSE